MRKGNSGLIAREVTVSQPRGFIFKGMAAAPAFAKVFWGSPSPLEAMVSRVEKAQV